MSSSSKFETIMQKTAIITGASRGMGRNTAVSLAKRGVDVIFTYHSNQIEAESLIHEIEAMGRKAAAFRLDTGNLRTFDGEVTNTIICPIARSCGKDQPGHLKHWSLRISS